ncbi:MAG: ABC transporter permease [Lachnospiraceae bacterium]|nr:ABC transporter permease [Lachnospiraceae bacterium]
MKKLIIKYFNMLIVPVILVIIWQCLSNAGLIYDVILPSPIKCWYAFVEIVKNGSLKVDLLVSLKRVLFGCLWGVGIGFTLGLLSGFSRVVERIVDPIINILRQIAIYAWIPLIILWFGIGDTSKVIIIAKAVLVPVYINTLGGIRDINTQYIELSKVLELDKWTFLSKIVFPSAAPVIFSGLRLSVSAAWTSVVAAEMLGGLTGLGYALLNAKDYLKSDRLIALMAVIAVIGILFDNILLLLQKQIFKWKEA